MQEYISQHPIYFAYTHVAPVILIICGIFMLFGLRWGRWLVFVWFVQAIIVDTMISPSHFWYPCVLFGLALCFLFRQPAMDYFRGAKQEIPKRDI